MRDGVTSLASLIALGVWGAAVTDTDTDRHVVDQLHHGDYDLRPLCPQNCRHCPHGTPRSSRRAAKGRTRYHVASLVVRAFFARAADTRTGWPLRLVDRIITGLAATWSRCTAHSYNRARRCLQMSRPHQEWFRRWEWALALVVWSVTLRY